MRKLFILGVVTLLSYTFVLAQNKSLGVGVASPNANAALHVESPTSNQGIIIPRLSTAQRSSFSAALSGTDIGLIVFDTDLRALAIWNGSAWDIGSKVGQPITATSASTTGNAGTFTITNALNNEVAINGTTTGTGHAAYLEVNNPANSNAALFVGTNGTGNAITANGIVQANAFVGDGSALTNLPAGGLALPYVGSNSSTASAFDITSIGDGNASSFTVNNVASNARSIYAATNGTGPALDIEKAGTGMAASIKQINPANTNTAVIIDNDGLGDALSVQNNNVGNNQVVLFARNFGSGAVANLSTNNTSNTNPAILSSTNGLGPVMSMTVNNAGNTVAGLTITHNGTGNGITTNAPIQASSFIGDGSALTNLPASGWGLGGNSGTTPGTDYIGTSDAQDVVFKTNNAEAVRILSSGQVGIGSTPVSAKLDVSSSNTTIGIHAATSAPSGVQNRGLQADASGSTAQNIGVYGTGFIDGSNGAIGVYGEAIGNGISDAFGLYGVTNNFTATTGKTYGVYASAENGSTNWAGYFNSGNVHIKNALSVGATDGTFGTTGQVLTSQGSGAAPTWSPLLPYTINTPSGGTLLDVTNSSGGMAASFASANGSQSLYVLNTGTGRAGMFNGSPSAEGVLTSQSGGAGAALSLFHLANGLAIDVQSGGVRVSNTSIVAPISVTTKVVLYTVTAGSDAVVLPSAQVGEMCWVYNRGGNNTVNVNSDIITNGTIRQFIYTVDGWTIVN